MHTRYLLTMALATLLTPVDARSCDPLRSIIDFSGNSTACHYKFRADGSGDVLTVSLLMRDKFTNLPCPDCPVECELVPDSGTIAFATCCPNPVSATTDAAGVAEFRFDAVCGRGTVTAVTRSLCSGTIVIDATSLSFTSTDLDAGAMSPVGVTNVFDLAIFAGSLGTPTPLSIPDLYANYTCDSHVNVFDLGFLAGGLAVSCAGHACP
jgi:hypothetical protein